MKIGKQWTEINLKTSPSTIC